MQEGWPENYADSGADNNLSPYTKRRLELSVEGCVLWGCGEVVPGKGREQAYMLHEAHPGVARMKSLARSYIWWLRMHKEIEGLKREQRVAKSASHPGKTHLLCH